MHAKQPVSQKDLKMYNTDLHIDIENVDRFLLFEYNLGICETKIFIDIDYISI